MTQFNLYVHGVPIGHEICGCDEELDYIKGFYSHEDKVKEASILQIDIVGGKSFYTYLRKKNVRNAEGRPGSYFGMTVSFPNMYCANVQMLYAIFDAIYKQVCVGCLIKAEDGGERFLVKEIASCRYGNNLIVDCIKSNFKNNLDSLRFETLAGFENSRGEARFSLEEVDSPLFCDTLKKKRIIVSPDYVAASTAYNSLQKELQPAKDECARLTRENSRLTEEKNSLAAEVTRLEKQLAHATASASEEYKRKLAELKAQLDKCEKEKADLSKKIEEATSAVELMDEPFKKLARLLAGRFQEDDKKTGKKNDKNPTWHWKGHWKTLWLPMGSLVLLLFAVCLCGITYRAVSQLSETVEVMRKGMSTTDVEPQQDSSQVAESEESADGTGLTTSDPIYDDFGNCVIDVSPSPRLGLQKGTAYTLSVKTKDYSRAANVPSGTWEATEGVTINGSTLQVNNETTSATNVLIFYTVNNKHELTRPLTIK